MDAKLVFHPFSTLCSQSRREKEKARERKERGCNLKDSAVDFKKHIAQAGLTERKRRRGEKKRNHHANPLEKKEPFQFKEFLHLS